VARAAFDTLVVVHALCAVVGFGAVGISGVYGFGARRLAGSRAVEEARRYFESPGRLELLILAVPFLGAAALAVQPGGRGVAQLWSGLAAGVWLVAAALLLAVVRPAERAVRAGLAAGGDRVAAAGGRLGWASVASDLAFFAAFVLMVAQPH
jgi:hypothetical protein